MYVRALQNFIDLLAFKKYVKCYI